MRLEAIGPVHPAYNARLRDVAGRLGVASRVSLTGPLPHGALPERLRGADGFLFLSTHTEGLSKAVMEAMAMAVPVVAYALPGLDGLIDDGVNGYLVPPRRRDLAAARLDALLADPVGARRMGEAARRKIATDLLRNGRRGPGTSFWRRWCASTQRAGGRRRRSDWLASGGGDGRAAWIFVAASRSDSAARIRHALRISG